MDCVCTLFNSIVTLIAQIVLAGFTVVLAIATVKLHRSTERYAEATEKLVKITEQSTIATRNMSQSTEQYTKFSGKLLSAEQLVVVDRLFHNLRTTNWQGEYKKANIYDLSDRIDLIYQKLVTKMLEDAENEFSHNDRD
jgi:hypothetical protein